MVSSSIEVTVGRLTKALPSLNEKRCDAAIRYAAEIYGNRTFELMPDITLFEHATSVAELLIEFCPDEDAVITCILQHAPKCDAASGTLVEMFGDHVRDMVSRVHLLSHLQTSDRRKSLDEMKNMLVSISDDIRILLLVLLIQTFFMEHVDKIASTYKTRLCRHSLELFAPIAARLGIYAIKYRLERSACAQCYPTDTAHIVDQLAQLEEENGLFLEGTVQELRSFLVKQGISADVVGRQKQTYSIFQKMQSKSVTALSKIIDLFAIRIIVPTLADCYQVLGLIHGIATPLSHRFKDYISFPKPNGYQSLHTCVIGLPGAPKNVMIEIQIRTIEMHREAEYGVAAHWLYKEKGEESTVVRSAGQIRLGEVLLQKQGVDSENTTFRLVDHIYVLTPRGDIIELPKGGTPLDFAFILHTDIGLRFKSARVNGAIVPINYRLENGDVVEILTHKHARPALQWIEALATPSARSKLKNYFFSHHRSYFLSKGKESVNRELKVRGLPPLDTELTVLHAFEGKEISIKQREDLLVKVGMESMRTSSLLRHLPVATKQVQKKANTPDSQDSKDTDLVIVEGESTSLPYRFAKCCHIDDLKPRPKEIVGIILRSGVVSVHRDGCSMAKASNPERRVPMRWTQPQ